MTHLLTSYLIRYVTACLVIPLALSSCADSAEQEPEPRIPAQYELTDVRYFLGSGDHIDTVVVSLAGLRVQNTSNTLTTQQLDTPVDDLVKTSQFALDPIIALPEEVNLSAVAIRVPAHWYSGELFTYFADSFSLHPAPQQKPYGPYAQQRLTLTVPPNSRLDVSRTTDAYYLTCSFEGVLTNKTTGQRYALRGKWKGLLRYNNLSTAFTQHPL